MAVMNLHRHFDNLSSRGAMKGRKQPRFAKLTYDKCLTKMKLRDIVVVVLTVLPAGCMCV